MDITQIYSIIVVFASALPIIVFLVYTFVISPEVSTEDAYFFCDQKLGYKELLTSFNASWVVAGSVIVAVLLLGQYYGLHNWWVVATFVASWFILARHVPAIRRYLSHTKTRTLHEFLGERYSSAPMRKLASLITVITVTGVIGLELIIGMTVIAALPALPHAHLIAFVSGFALAVIVALYTICGGLLAIVRTDIYQWIGISCGMLSMILIGILYFFHHDPTHITELENLDVWAPSGPVDLWPFYVGIALNQLPVVLADFGTWQRIGASNRKITSKLPAIARWAGVIQGIVWLFLAGIGMSLVPISIPNQSVVNEATFGGVADPLIRVIHASIEIGASQPLLGGLLLFFFIVGIICALLSSADSYLLAATQTMTRDFRRHSTAEGVDDSKVVKEGRIWAGIFIGAAWLLAIFATIYEVALVPLVFTFFGALVIIAGLAIFALRPSRPVSTGNGPYVKAIFVVYAIAIIFGLFTSFSKAAGEFLNLNGGFLVAAISMIGTFLVLAVKLARHRQWKEIPLFFLDLLGLRRYSPQELEQIEGNFKSEPIKE
jgi:Na+/proline symporter